jgi:hypothetical protein
MKLPKIITHKNMGPLLDQLQREPYFKIGSKVRYDPEDWYWKIVHLEVPTGELAEDTLKTIAIVGHGEIEHLPLTGKEGFNAQGLEGKVSIAKRLFNALMNMRDLIPERRGRIVT